MSPVPSSTEGYPLDHTRRELADASISSLQPNSCITYTVSGPGFFQANDSFSFNFTQDATLAECGENATIGDNDAFLPTDPYFASTSPVLFVLGVCVTVAWILLLMLLMTPRTYLTGGGGLSQRRPDAGINVVGVGSRPWFQKVATLFVAIALLIATAKTFGDAEEQYNQRYQNSVQLTYAVFDSKEIRVIRFISTLFEWLAQAQTALRLFPRHRERIAIKWVALSLICLEMVFQIINSFTNLGQSQWEDSGYYVRPRHAATALPALQYLFELALSLMYAGCIAYYALTKRRFAFYHPDMWNMSLVAVLSITAVLVPVVFFVLDIAVPNIASWGDYVRWVGAAAASVVVWEWVERIEALEREERRDGILGREIYEGDDSLGGDSGGRRRSRRKRNDADHPEVSSPGITSSGTGSSTSSSLKKPSPDTTTSRYKHVPRDVLRKVATIRNLARIKATKAITASKGVELQPITGAVRRRKQRENSIRPLPVDPATLAQTSATPVSRSDCTSASTVYRVIHHPASPSSTPGISETLGQNMNIVSPVQEEPESEADAHTQRRRSMVDSFFPSRRRSSGQSQNNPPEIIAHQAQASGGKTTDAQGKSKAGRGFLSRFRLNNSEEKELPELVVPWRGEDAAFAQQDLESGQATRESSSDDPASLPQQNRPSRSDERQAQLGSDDDNQDSYMAHNNGQVVSNSGAVTFSEDPEHANRNATRSPHVSRDFQPPT